MGDASGGDFRRSIATLAEQLYAGAITYEHFLDAFPEETDDEDLSELLDLIEHEPKCGGLLGVPEEEHARHLARIRELIAKLRAS